MKKIFNRITNTALLTSILAIIIGLVFIVYPDMTLETLGIVGAIYLIVNGIAMIVLELKLSKVYVPFESMINGVLSIILGIVLFAYPNSASILLTIAFGIWIIVSSINNIKIALFLRKIESFPTALMILFSILEIILGVLVIVNPFEASITLTLYLGIVLIVNSVFNIVDVLILKKNIKGKEKAIKEILSKINIDN